MPVYLTTGQLAAWGGTLEQRVANFAAALDAHAYTVDVPRPTEHPLVERIVAAGGYAQVIVQPDEEPEPVVPPSLEAAKQQATATVNAAAEATRLLFVTPGSGQAMVYLLKEREAHAYIAAGSPANPPAGSYPLLEAEIAAAADADDPPETLASQAAAVIAQADAWAAVGASIERHRRARVRQIDKATTVQEAMAAAGWTWEPPA